MDEFKAQDAENHYREAQIDSNQIAYAPVMIKNGEAALKDLMINSQPIKEILEQKKKTTP